jgi:hypothetical protein
MFNQIHCERMHLLLSADYLSFRVLSASACVGFERLTLKHIISAETPDFSHLRKLLFGIIRLLTSVIRLSKLRKISD